MNVKKDLTNAPPTFKLIESIVNNYLSLTIDNEVLMSERERELVWKTFSTLIRLKVLLHLWKYGATTIPEIVYIFKISRQTAKNALDALVNAGLAVITKKLLRPGGGNTSVIYAIPMPICGPDVSIAAQKRHDQIKGISSNAKFEQQRMDENAEINKQHDEHQAKEESEARRQDVIALVKDHYFKQYTANDQAVNVQKIHDSVRREGFSYSEADDITQKIAQLLEEEDIPTVIQIGKKSTPSYHTLQKFIEIRKRRENK